MNPVFFFHHLFMCAVVGARMKQLHKPFASLQVHKGQSNVKLKRKTGNRCGESHGE